MRHSRRCPTPRRHAPGCAIRSTGSLQPPDLRVVTAVRTRPGAAAHPRQRVPRLWRGKRCRKKGGGGPAGIFRRVLPRTRTARVQGVCAASAAGHPSPRPPALPFCYPTFKYFLPAVRSERRARTESRSQTAPTASSAPAPPTAAVWLGLQG